VKEHAHFLKQIKHAMAIRDKIQEVFERATKPGCSREDRERLLSIAVVGGGPTSIEFAGELYDWVMQDGAHLFPDLIDQVSITLLEASDNILTGFGKDLAGYTIKTFRKRKIKMMLNSAVVNVEADHIELADGYKLPYGVLVWATGITQNALTKTMDWEKARNGSIVVDDYLMAKPNVFCIGDCAFTGLPPTAQVANQQAKYVAKRFNSTLSRPRDEFEANFNSFDKTFHYMNLGVMAYIGNWNAVYSAPHHNAVQSKWAKRLTNLKGIWASIMWQSAYLGKQVSWSNRILIPMHWFKSWAFGRDFSRF